MSRPFALGAALFTVAGLGRAQLLLGGGQGPIERALPGLDARIPRGAARLSAPRPAWAEEPPACSARYPVCVHRAEKADYLQAITWLGALESAYERVVLCLGAPGPLDDAGRGGTPALDMYLEQGDRALWVGADASIIGAARDTSAAFCVAGDREAPIERAATLCLAEAIAVKLDAAETPFTRRALATELWFHTGLPTSADVRALDDAQAEPERAIVARDLTRSSEGGALLFEYLDVAKGRGLAAQAALATYALSAGPPSPPSLRWTNEPDTLDVLRATFGPTPTDVARFFGDFSLARAFLGTRDASSTWPLLRFAGDFGRVRFEWSVPFSSLPRRLSPARPIEPTGSTYLYVALDGSAGGQSIAFQADWEPPVSFRWTLALVASNGRIVRRMDVPYLERETHVERIVGDLTGGAGLLIAGTNLGGLGPSYPFDPDFEPFEPHGYTVYLAKQ
jgi:hypothetical protein